MTVGKPTRVAMRDSMINRQCNNFSIKLSGLVPSATSYLIPSGEGKLNKYFPNTNYYLTSSCKSNNWRYKDGKLLGLNKVILPSKINGNYVMM